MKKLILSTVLLLGISSLFVFYSCADDSGKELAELAEYKYKGPKNSSELEAVLNENTHSVIAELSKDKKESLVKYAVFHNGRFRGFGDADDNINLLNNTNMVEVLSVVLQTEIVHRKWSESLSSIRSRAGGDSYCSNCFPIITVTDPDLPDTCCTTGGRGCYDYPDENTCIE